MDSVKFLLYTLARIGLMIACAAFGILFGRVLCPAVITLLPDGAFRDTLIDPSLRSGLAFAMMLGFLIAVFVEDGKKHAAYEIWSSVNVTITLIFMVMVYFVPSIFRDSFEPYGKANAFYEVSYFPFDWLEDLTGAEFLVRVALGLGIMGAVLFGVYLAAFKRYAKAHPFILGGPKRGEDKIPHEEEEPAEEMNLLNE
ncbi:MAG: hypothetical protein IKP47_05155 [Ruminococcus sp.]|nr:hypothetical protein [Ruminococcus sp.]